MTGLKRPAHSDRRMRCGGRRRYSLSWRSLLCAFLLLLFKQLFEGGIIMQAGELAVACDLFAGGKSLVECHAQVLESAISVAGTGATRRHVIVHRATFLYGRRILNRGGAVIGKDMRINGQSLLVSCPTLVVPVFR